MKSTKDNLYYFNVSKKNPEKPLDDFYIFEEKHPNLHKYIENAKEIKNILITIKTLQDKREGKEILRKYFLELSNLLGKFSNCSEFGCFINACDSVINFAKNDVVLLEKITQKYFNKRILNEFVPEEWVQAILDSNSSRKKGVCGERKLLHILKGNGFIEVKTWEEFFDNSKNRCAARFSKVFSLKNIRNKLGIKLSAKKQNKKLDLLIKLGPKIFLLEAKHLNTGGGGQDKQISELIEIISLKEANKNISYIAFLDGVNSNILLSDIGSGGKLLTQRREINNYLNSNPNNFWVNTFGFGLLFKK